jgi:hypothetical protein
LALLAAVAVMTAGADAQQSQSVTNAQRIGSHAAAAAEKSAVDEAKVKANDKAYNAALKNLPDKQYDPWRGVR